MRLAVLVLVALAPLGCGGGLPSQDATDIVNATRLTGASYAHQDAGTAGAALIREAFCDLDKVAQDQKLTRIDSGIPCN